MEQKEPNAQFLSFPHVFATDLEEGSISCAAHNDEKGLFSQFRDRR